MDNQVLQAETETKGSFYIESTDGVRMAEMTYSKAGDDRIIIDHTEVNPDYKSEGLGEKLVLRAVETARKKDLKIIPLCRFANAMFKRHSEWHNVL